MSATGWGAAYERPISFPLARKLALPALPPRRDGELLIAERTILCGKLPIPHKLVLVNIADRFLLASPTIERDEWLAVFGVTGIYA